MKLILEFTKPTEQDLPKIYCDMDQVLCNFVGGAEDLLGRPFIEVKKDERWDVIKAKKDFWHTLEWMPGSERMWKFINRYNANILSAYSHRDPNCRPGKKHWLQKNAKPKGEVHLVERAAKQKFATTNGKPNILIDDYIKNIKEWEAAGGIGIHHTNPSSSISQLKRYGFK